MQLIAILLTTVSILTLLSGIAVLVGSKKSDRGRSAWFFAATLFATIWMISISLFLVAAPDWPGSLMVTVVNLTYLSAIFIDIALLGYIIWHNKYGKIAMTIFSILGIIIAWVFVVNPTLLYTDIVLTNAGNSLITNVGPFYFIYVIFFCALVPAVIVTLIRQIIKSKSDRTKNGSIVLLVGFGISGTASLVFNLILTFWTWHLVWIGPFAISATMLTFYYTILRYHTLKLDSIWLRILSYVVLITSAAVLYMIVFYLVFLAMFRGSTPSIEVVILNFVMVLFFLLLVPAMSELTNFVHSLISGDGGKKDTNE